MSVVLTGEDLEIDDVVRVAREAEPVEIAEEALARVADSRADLETRMADGEVIYGVNTGFGALAGDRIPPEDVETLQENLLRSHAFGVGEPADQDEVRAMVLLRLNSLLNGNSGVRERTIYALRDLLNEGVYPHVPRKGSASASGDLAPLAHVALVLIGEGKANVGGEWVDGKKALERAGIEPLTLKAKEGLALVNGTNYVTAVGALAVHDARTLVESADTVGGLSLEGLAGISDAFRPELHELRGQPGQELSARRIRELFADGSELVTPSADPDDVRAASDVQDPYSLRCMPQVHGATRDVIAHVEAVVERELNAVTDNPLVLDDGDVVSGGNFHAQPVALALDSLATAVAELANISERRIFNLVAGEEGGSDADGGRGNNADGGRGIDAEDDRSRGDALPSFLVEGDRPGLNSGFMIPQVTAAALVSENKTLVHPSSSDSVPTSDNQEDHVSMGANAANHLQEVLDNVTTVLAIEAFAAFQALWLRDREPGEGTQEILERLDERIDPIESDRFMRDDLDEVVALIEHGTFDRS